MKKISLLLMVLVLLMSCMPMGWAEDYTPGVTVTADPDSPTGYTATFVYEDAEAEKVTLVSGFAYYFDDGSRAGTVPEKFYTPYEWQDGMFPAQVNRYVVDLEKVEDTDYWSVSFPVASGHYQYYYTVNGEDTVIFDPANYPMQSHVIDGGTYEASVVDVPWDGEKQAKTRDYSFAMPNPDNQDGTVEFLNYSDVNGDTRALAVYTPYTYDAKREEPYPVLYISHGGGGNEVHWFEGTNAHYIFDNLIAEGKMEPALIVCMNNTNYTGWDYEVIGKNVMEHIIPYIEGKYNVSTEPADRAFCGQSMGGMTTSNMYRRYADQFGYFGIWSGADTNTFVENMDTINVETLKQPKLMLAAGIYDFGYQPNYKDKELSSFFQNFVIDRFMDEVLDANGIAYDFFEVEGAHDWYIWQQLLYKFGAEYLWK